MKSLSVLEKDPPIEQPQLKRGPPAGVPKYYLGAPRSVGRLKHLKFDPIGELVSNYRRLEKELEYQEKVRAGEIVELTSTGRPKSYRPEVHHAIYDKLIAIGDKLLRYGYGRVPEAVDEAPKAPMPLIVNLTKKGETYVVNDEQPQGEIQNEDNDSDSHE